MYFIASLKRIGLITSQQKAYSIPTKIIKVYPFSIRIGQQRVDEESENTTQCHANTILHKARSLSRSHNLTQPAINFVACDAVLFDTVTTIAMKLRKHDSMLCEVAVK